MDKTNQTAEDVNGRKLHSNLNLDGAKTTYHLNLLLPPRPFLETRKTDT